METPAFGPQMTDGIDDRPWWQKRRWVWGLVVLALLGGAYAYDQATTQQDVIEENADDALGGGVQLLPDETPPTPDPNKPLVAVPASTPTKTVEAAGAFKLTSKSAQSCTAEAPADWTMTAGTASNTADLFGPGKRLYAGYGIQAVNTQLAGFASAYQPPLNDPDLYSDDPATVVRAYGKAILAAIGGSGQLAYTSDTYETIGAYTLRSVASSSHKGVIFYHTEGFPGDGVNYSYAEPMYFAFTTNDLWAANGTMVAQVAASIRCSTQFQPRDQYVVTAADSSSSSATDTNGDADGYNPQLGTEYVHDQSTGENYLVDPSQHWSSDGPSGAGYYKANGNDYTKLDPGRAD